LSWEIGGKQDILRGHKRKREGNLTLSRDSEFLREKEKLPRPLTGKLHKLLKGEKKL